MAEKKLIRFDWAMKYMLRNKANFDILEAFISNLLGEEIRVEEILESESNREAENRKFNRVDLKCRNSKKEQIIIEVQNQREVDYLQRLLWGTSKAVVESIELGDAYKKVDKVISISILYHDMKKEDKENTDFIYYGTTQLYGIHTKKPLVLHETATEEETLDTVFTEKKELVTSKNVFPEYYVIYVEKFNDMISRDIDEWVYFFKYGKIKEEFKSPGILLAAQKLDYLMMEDKERRAYEDYLSYLAQEKSILETAKEEGREEAREEERSKIAIKLLKIGLSVEDIAEVTKLSIQEIEGIIEDLGI